MHHLTGGIDVGWSRWILAAPTIFPGDHVIVRFYTLIDSIVAASDFFFFAKAKLLSPSCIKTVRVQKKLDGFKI